MIFLPEPSKLLLLPVLFRGKIGSLEFLLFGDLTGGRAEFGKRWFGLDVVAFFVLKGWSLLNTDQFYCFYYTVWSFLLMLSFDLFWLLGVAVVIFIGTSLSVMRDLCIVEGASLSCGLIDELSNELSSFYFSGDCETILNLPIESLIFMNSRP